VIGGRIIPNRQIFGELIGDELPPAPASIGNAALMGFLQHLQVSAGKAFPVEQWPPGRGLDPASAPTCIVQITHFLVCPLQHEAP
jgi:hypothetical protein